jgi:hypothetical protein
MPIAAQLGHQRSNLFLQPSGVPLLPPLRHFSFPATLLLKHPSTQESGHSVGCCTPECEPEDTSVNSIIEKASVALILEEENKRVKEIRPAESELKGRWGRCKEILIKGEKVG